MLLTVPCSTPVSNITPDKLTNNQLCVVQPMGLKPIPPKHVLLWSNFCWCTTLFNQAFEGWTLFHRSVVLQSMTKKLSKLTMNMIVPQNFETMVRQMYQTISTSTFVTVKLFLFVHVYSITNGTMDTITWIVFHLVERHSPIVVHFLIQL